jgi:phage-related putative DNA binding protein|nr:MAG TPA: terminase small subunit [Caudoviricetes sp.]
MKEGDSVQRPSNKKPKFDDIVQPEWLAYVCYLYRDEHLTDEGVAEKLGVSRNALFKWRKKSDKLNNAINLGKELTDQQVENALYKSAISGNVTAMIFWLKNRKPGRWNDVNKLDVNTEIVVIQDDI